MEKGTNFGYDFCDQTKRIKGSGSRMSNVSTKIIEALLKNESVNEVFRQELESALNQLFTIELDSFLNYGRYDPAGYNSGDSRNGYYRRILHTEYGDLNLLIPRDREGLFHQKTLAPYQRNSDTMEAAIIELYRHGITTREIADLIEKMYGQFYTPQTVSNISRAVEEQVAAFHSRPVSDRYSVIFCDATYLNVRRDSVAKEALHILIGITPDGTKELLDFALYPTESAENYKEMLNGLKERGLQQVLLFVTDGLKGLKSAVLEAFPAARYQSCWTHICRNVMKHIRAKDKRSVMDDLKKVYTAATRDDAISALHDFFEKYHQIYPKVIDILNDLEDLFTYYAFPKAIQRSIYTTNLIENFNKNLKRGTKAKEQFPNEDALERYVCSYCMDYNRRFSLRIHKGFQTAQAELMEMFGQ